MNYLSLSRCPPLIRMTTKNCCLSLHNGKQQQQHRSFSSSDTSDRYSNLNLNQNHKCSNLNSIQSDSYDTKTRKGNAFNDDNVVSDSLGGNKFSKTKNTSWNKFTKDQSKSFNLHHAFENKNLKPPSAINSNSSTLSLHIAAYENAVEEALDQGCNSVVGEKAKKNSGGKAWKSVRQQLTASSISSKFQCFEIPRQQQPQQEEEDDDVMVEPEVMQFKATQKLLDPNSSSAAKKDDEGEKKGGDEKKKDEEKDEKKDDTRETNLISVKTKATLSEIRDHFAKLCLVKSPTTGRILSKSSSTSPELLTIFSQWSFRSPTMKKNLKNSQITIFDTQKVESICVDAPVTEAEGQCVAYSPDGKVSAVISTIPGENKDKKHYVRIIDAVNNCDKNIFNLSAKKAHGLVHLSGDFGGAVFSPSGKYLLYTAERYANLVEFYDADLDAKTTSAEEEDDTKKPAIGDKFLWKQTFGEQLYEANDPVLCLLTVESGEVKILDSVPKHLHPVQKLFSADESTVYFGAVDATNYKLGKVFCTNRPYTIGRIELKEFGYSCIAEKIQGLEFLKRSNDGTIFGISRTNSKESHQGNYSFFKLNPTSADKPVEPYTHDDIFLPALPPRCFTSKDAIVYTAIEGCYLKAFKFDPATSDFVCLTPGEKSDTVLDVFEDYILVSRAAPDRAPELCLGKFTSDKEVSWAVISKQNPISVDHTVENVGTIDNKFGPYSFVMIPKKPTKDIPLVVLIHGGPHSASLKVWPRREPNLLIHLGFAVLQINYPGSIGYGEDYVQQLPGKVGELDVEFCEKAIDECLKKFPQLDKSKVSLLGGSHGGFLVTHLAGHKPDNYKAVVSLNPVLNIRSMYDITDIPDWCAYESNLSPLEPGKPLNAELEKQMIARSPITRAHNIKAPYLLVIGGKDLRVPPHFRALIRTLSVNKIPHKVLYYPDSNHALDEVDVEADFSINAALWFQSHGM